MKYPHKKIDNNSKYYAFTLLADTQKRIYIDAYTEWTGFADKENRIELRKPSIVSAQKLADKWKQIRTPFCVVNTIDDFLRWFINGGHSLVKTQIVQDLLPNMLKEDSCLRTGQFGYTSKKLLHKSVFRSAPTSKKRSEIIKRDKYKCRICGRRPDNNVDIELQVHHIKPYGMGGLTHEDNLITLCHTCHSGLEPHYEWDLFNLISYDHNESIAAKYQREYLEGVRNYRIARQGKPFG